MNKTETYINYFAQTDFRGRKVPFGIKDIDRAKHVYIIGKTGMGKSTLLENMCIQDIKNGEGLAFIDPHGSSAEQLLDYVPKDRVKDVVYFAPFDTDHPISFNVMEDVGADKRHLVVNGLMSAFKKLFGEESFSDRMQYILQNTILALLEYPGSTMLGINRMLTDKKYREKVVANVTDASVKAYWTQEFANYTERFAAEATPAIQNKIGQFTSNPLIRNIIGQPKSSIDFRKVMDEKKILIINLSKGRLGDDNAKLIGSMLITKLYLAAMSRASSSAAEMYALPPFYFMVDEFQNFVNDSFADILSEARKYKLCLTIAHQYVEQMPENVRDAVFGNVGTTIAFRVGPFDAELLEKVFIPTFTAQDLVNLGKTQIYLSLSIDGVGSAPFSAATLPPIVSLEESHKAEIIAYSQEAFGRPRAEVEQVIMSWMEEDKPAPKKDTDHKNDYKPSAPKGSQQSSSKPPFAERRKIYTPVPIERRRNPEPQTQSSLPPREQVSERIEPKPLPQAVPVHSTPEQKPVSLTSLKSNVKDSGKNKDALRSALQSLLGQQATVQSEEKKEAPKTMPPQPVVAPEPKKPEPVTQPPKSEIPSVKLEQASKPEPVVIPQSEPKPKLQTKGEIPEDVLRQMLDVKKEG